MFIYYIVSGLRGGGLRSGGPQECRGAEDLICPAVHVRPLRGLSMLLALSPGRSRSWWLASRRPRARSTTWGYSWCDPSGVSARPKLSVVCCCHHLRPQRGIRQSASSLRPRRGIWQSASSLRPLRGIWQSASVSDPRGGAP